MSIFNFNCVDFVLAHKQPVCVQSKTQIEYGLTLSLYTYHWRELKKTWVWQEPSLWSKWSHSRHLELQNLDLNRKSVGWHKMGQQSGIFVQEHGGGWGIGKEGTWGNSQLQLSLVLKINRDGITIHHGIHRAVKRAVYGLWSLLWMAPIPTPATCQDRSQTI